MESLTQRSWKARSIYGNHLELQISCASPSSTFKSNALLLLFLFCFNCALNYFIKTIWQLMMKNLDTLN
ncbi:hypothetical protein NC653_031404 [Populus alba x Populus x berolinensis]|uniref:Uncharacterized protein n=1 Tax=Populus alba x Populus x berolinensis TaxID=444605 RepID=A0AAD6LYE3_9ROSI|nr:hypothetical protein NC653_031404 [Populus alba x Populus x berolinensis]